MSTDREVERIVRSWMDEGVTALPDRVLDLVLDQVPATPQRRAGWLARRFSTLSTYARYGLVAAALVLAAVIGIGIYANSVGNNPPVTSQSPIPSIAPLPSASPLATPIPDPIVGTWAAPATTCAQQIATLEAAGFTREEMTLGGMDPTCVDGIVGEGVDFSMGSQFTLTFHSAGSLTLFEDGVMGWSARYSLGEGSTFEVSDSRLAALCTTWRFAIDGDQLTIEMVAPSCGDGAAVPIHDQLAQTAIFETSPFRLQP